MNRFLAGGAIASVMLAGFPLMVMSSGAQPVDQTCVNFSSGPVVASDSSAAQLDAQQVQNAATVIAAGRRRGLSDQGIVIALATALQESRLRIYANDGAGGDLAPDQHGVAESLRLPHEAVGSDHGSVGVFQQQWPWWGTMRDLMDPAASAGIFYSALVGVPGWQEMPVTMAAQAVQRSAYPAAYADDEPVARRLLTDLGGGIVGIGAECASAPGAGTVRFPLPAGSGYIDQVTFGNRGSKWASRHTGTDFSLACGTPVLAATSGTVEIRRDQPWAGPWLVKVSTGAGKLTTWYAHMRRVLVADGAVVSGGQQIGEVGDLGNATGCHLHFEVHPRGGSIYQDPVDPTVWLREHVGRPLPGSAPTQPPISSGSSGLVVATFNTLGASHTTASGKRPTMASGATRTRWALRLLDAYAVDVVGLQEFQAPQRRAFHLYGRGTYATWSPAGDTENSVAWRRSTIELLSASTVGIPYFNGHQRRMPVVRLRVRATGQEFYLANFHNPADTSRFPHQARWRAEATAREVRLVASLGRSQRVPILVTGDMNERASIFCRFTASGQMTAAAGGSHQGSCQPPQRPGIDWIFGSTRGVRFSSYTVDNSRLVDKTTDHPLVLTRAELVTE